MVEHLEFPYQLAVFYVHFPQGAAFQLLGYDAPGDNGDAVIVGYCLLGGFGVIAEPGVADGEIVEGHIFHKPG